MKYRTNGQVERDSFIFFFFLIKENQIDGIILVRFTS